jgi:hypothetical protein
MFSGRVLLEKLLAAHLAQRTSWQPISLRSILILSFLGSCYPSCLRSSVRIIILHVLLIFSMRAMSNPSQLPLFEYLNNIWQTVQIMKPQIMKFSSVPYYVHSWRSKYLLTALCSNTFNTLYALLFIWGKQHLEFTVKFLIFLKLHMLQWST